MSKEKIACAPLVAGPLEATAIGNVLMQAVGSGDLANLAEARLTPRPADWQPFDRWLRDFRRDRGGDVDQDPLIPTEDEIARINGPIGLDIGAKSPAEIAIAIMAEMTEHLRRPEVRK